MVSRLFQSTDTDAPSMGSNTTGSLISVLKAVLVNGYGSTASLGYTLEFEDIPNNVAVFRASQGTRFFLRIDDNGYGGTVKYATVLSYETMSDVNTGMESCPATSISTDYKSIVKSYTNVEHDVSWYIIGDEKGFWLMCNGYESGNVHDGIFTIVYFGDYLPIDMTKTSYAYCSITDTHPFKNRFQPNYSYATHLMRDPRTNDRGSVPFYPLALTLTVNSSSFGQNYALSPVNGRYLYTNIVVAMSTTADPIGILPGLLNTITYTPFRFDPFFDTIGSNTVFQFNTFKNNSVSYYNRMAIKIGASFRNVN